VPASFEFCLASLKRDAHSSGTSIRLDSSAGEAQLSQQLGV